MSLHELLDVFFAVTCSLEGEPCINASDAISAVPGGLAAGLVAVWVYAYRKNCEYADNRNDMAEIQANEIRRNMGALELRDKGPLRPSPYNRLPSLHVYKGLLSSGNIRYFDSNLQDLLDQIRSDFETSPFALDIARCTKALERLEKVKSSHDRHFTPLPGWRWFARRKLRSKGR